jgi:hypothetical protein
MTDTDNNYLMKNIINTDRDHPEPNLIGKYDYNTNNHSDSPIIKEDSVVRNTKGLETTDTNYMFEYFANNDKMIDYNNPIRFEKPEKSYNDDNYSNTHHTNIDSDDLKDFLASDKKDSVKYKAHSSGPSIGPDSHSYKHSDRSSEKYEKKKKESEFESEEDEMLAKLDMLRKLGELTKHGVKLSQNYSMNSDIKSMRYEYELHRSIRDKYNGVKWLSSMMTNICWGAEIANDKFNPFDFKLQGWSEQVNEDMDDYHDVFGELYEKYFKSGKPIPPELKLFFMISGSAVKFHLTKSTVHSLPNVGEAIDKDPELAQNLRQQAANDKMRESMMNEHNISAQKAADIQMLRRSQHEYVNNKNNQNNRDYQDNRDKRDNRDNQSYNSNNQSIQSEIIKKQIEIENLQKQLNMLRSDTRSMYSSNYNEQQTMKPVLPSRFMNNNNNQDVLRQQHIMEQKRLMQQRELNRARYNDNISNESPINYNPNLDQILGNKLNEISTIDMDDLSNSEDSKVVLGKKRNVRRKNNLKIST